MLFQTTTPDTLNYMVIGYLVFFGLPLIFIGSLWWRQRNLEKDVELLKELKQDEQEQGKKT
jgi:cell division protein FtsB